MATQAKKAPVGAPIRPKQVQLIHILSQQIGQSRDDYEGMLYGYRGATSSKELTEAEGDQVIDDLIKKGAVVKSKPRPARPRSKGKNVVHLANQGEHDKVKALAALIPWQVEDGFSRFLVKRCQVRSGKVRTAAEAYRAIEALKKYFANLMAGNHGRDWWTIRFDDQAIERFISEHAPAEYRAPATGKVYKRAA